MPYHIACSFYSGENVSCSSLAVRIVSYVFPIQFPFYILIFMIIINFIIEALVSFHLDSSLPYLAEGQLTGSSCAQIKHSVNTSS